jgi:prepilin-type N-terminal cleavage/methylation domain-containing protein
MFNIANLATKVNKQLAQNPEKKTQKGVTLIEVLIVVTIILFLMIALYRTIGINVEKARDADRKKDLKEIKVAFENYYNDKNCYPPADSLDTCDSTVLAPYLPQVPCDKIGQKYLYLPEANAQGPTCGG